MNILTTELPKTVDINGVRTPINTDFRASIQFETAILAGEKDEEKLLGFYFDEIPKDKAEALQAIELFFCCGNIPKGKDRATRKTAQAYSFEDDASAIFADFWNVYNIDLSAEGLHWWAFRALLEGLPEKSEFKQRIYYRTVESKDLKGLSKKERERILSLKKRLEIKSDNKGGRMTLEERNESYINYVKMRSSGGDT